MNILCFIKLSIQNFTTHYVIYGTNDPPLSQYLPVYSMNAIACLRAETPTRGCTVLVTAELSAGTALYLAMPLRAEQLFSAKLILPLNLGYVN